MREALERLLNVVLVLSGVAMAVVVVRREVFTTASTAQTATAQPKLLNSWDHVLASAVVDGKSDAPVKIIEFMDLQCPFCRTFNVVTRKIRAKYGSAVAVAFVHLPIAGHQSARLGARAAECAARQGRFVPFVDAVYAKQDSMQTKSWTSYAQDAAVPEVAAFSRCMGRVDADARVNAGLRVAEQLAVHATPTVIVNGWQLGVPPSEAELDRIVGDIIGGRMPFPKQRWGLLHRLTGRSE